jgi:hypothetical protein
MPFQPQRNYGTMKRRGTMSIIFIVIVFIGAVYAQ